MAIEWKKIAYVENSAAQSVLGNPTGSPAVASAITVAEQTLVGRITGGNVDDLSVTQVKTLIGSSTTSATGVIELATQAEVLAGTDTSRAVVPVDLAARIAIDVNPKAMSQGVNMTYVASGSTGIVVADNDNIDFGTGDFTLVWKGSLPDWTPSADTFLIRKRQGASGSYIGYMLYLATSGSFLRLYFTNLVVGASSILVDSSYNLTDGTTHEIVASVVRETALIDGSVSIYIDGLLVKTEAVTARTAPDISNTANLYLSGYDSARHASTTQFAATFNRALSAAEVLDLYRNGINQADKWGSQTAVYTSDFSAGVDGWVAVSGDTTLTGNTDSINGSDDWLKVERTGASAGSLGIYRGSTVTALNKYAMRVTIYNPVGSTITHFRFGHTSAADNYLNIVSVPAGSEVTAHYYSSPGTDASIVYEPCAADGSVATFPQNEKYYMKTVVITKVGATLALEPEGIQPAPGQWLDSSTNKLHAWQPVAGSSLTRKKTEFEIRGINTWTASHAAQSIAMTSDASRVMLPPNCYIESIVGVVAGADIEDIIIGDGSDADRWVELTTGLAAGTVSFMLANRISDGTNYELVVDPDADCTMTITWTIKGYILD